MTIQNAGILEQLLKHVGSPLKMVIRPVSSTLLCGAQQRPLPQSRPFASRTPHICGGHISHTAFTKNHASGMQSKVLTEPGSQARTPHTAWFQGVVSNPRYANACIGATGCDVRSSR